MMITMIMITMKLKMVLIKIDNEIENFHGLGPNLVQHILTSSNDFFCKLIFADNTQQN